MRHATGTSVSAPTPVMARLRRGAALLSVAAVAAATFSVVAPAQASPSPVGAAVPAGVGTMLGSAVSTTAVPLALKPGQGFTKATGTKFVDGKVFMVFDITRLPTAGALYLGGQLRMNGVTSGYRPRVKVLPSGELRLDLKHLVNGAEQTVGGDIVVPARVRAGQQLVFETHVSGTTTPTLRSRTWIVGAPKPTWQMTRQHTASNATRTAGDTGLSAYLSSSSSGITMSYRSLAATPEPTAAPVVAAAPQPGSVKPSASNTGVPAGTPLRVHNGDLTITTAGTVVDAVDVRGFLRVYAPNVTVKRSVIRGGKPVRVEGVVTVSTKATNFVIQDSEVYPSQPSVMLDGIKGANFTARRVHVHGGVDNIKVHGSNVLIESSYLHDQHYYASDPLQRGGPTHNDALQVLGGDNIRVVGNTLHSRKELNAALQVTQDFAPVTRMVFDKNWADGGGCTVNVNHKKLAELRGGITMRDNVFGRGTRYGSCGIILTTKAFPTMSGNKYTDGVAVSPKYMAAT